MASGGQWWPLVASGGHWWPLVASGGQWPEVAPLDPGIGSTLCGHISTWFCKDLTKEPDVLNHPSVPDFWAHAWSAWFGGRATVTTSIHNTINIKT